MPRWAACSRHANELVVGPLASRSSKKCLADSSKMQLNRTVHHNRNHKNGAYQRDSDRGYVGGA